ncbi:MAG: hypothetical protein KF726_24640 [Anaerolineae bacterium]|nr:hypothetical protein [Anaerolineae bacterium]
MNSEFLGQSWAFWGLIALIIAAIFAVFVPARQRIAGVTGIQFIIVRWFHSLVWLLLAISFFLRSVQSEFAASIADPLAGAAGIVYLIYIVTMMRIASAR